MKNMKDNNSNQNKILTNLNYFKGRMMDFSLFKKKKNKSNITPETSDEKAFNVINIHSLKKDGVDHININPLEASTELGRLLMVSAYTPFIHPILGSFTSLDGYWFYLKTKGADDCFRMGRENTAHRRKAKEFQQYRYNEFYDFVMDGFYEKIIQNPRIEELFLKNDLPIVNYYMSGKVRVSPPGLNFVVRGLNNLCEKMKEGIKPERPDYSKVFSHVLQLK